MWLTFIAASWGLASQVNVVALLLGRLLYRGRHTWIHGAKACPPRLHWHWMFVHAVMSKLDFCHSDSACPPRLQQIHFDAWLLLRVLGNGSLFWRLAVATGIREWKLVLTLGCCYGYRGMEACSPKHQRNLNGNTETLNQHSAFNYTRTGSGSLSISWQARQTQENRTLERGLGGRGIICMQGKRQALRIYGPFPVCSTKISLEITQLIQQ